MTFKRHLRESETGSRCKRQPYMTEFELKQRRRAIWRVNGEGVRTLDEATQWMREVGMCLMFPVARPATLGPTFMGAYTGNDERLPEEQHAYKDPRAQEARELVVRMLRQRAAYEARMFGESNLLLSAESFPYFFALVGDRNPGQSLKKEKSSQLVQDAYALLEREGPISKRRLAERLGGAISEPALDRALGELWSKLRIMRVDYRPGEGAFWDVLHRWAPEAVREGTNLSLAQGLSALISKYLEAVVAAEQSDIENFFSAMAPRSRVREAVHALLAAREFSFVSVGKKTMIEITPEPQPHAARGDRRVAAGPKRDAR